MPENEKFDPRIYLFGADYHWRIGRDPVAGTYGQADKVAEKRLARFGPSLPFAMASLEQHSDLVIGLIPCGKNSSGIIQWQMSLSDQSLYASCMKRIRVTLPMGKILWILFFQGETDAADPIQYPDLLPLPLDWPDLFSAFVTNFRNDLGNPELPVVLAQIGTNG